MREGILQSKSIGHALARDVIEGAQRRADELGITIAVALVDAAGNLVAAGRMDGAPFGVTILAIDKAFTAAAFGAPTDSWQQSTQPGGADWGMHTSLGGRLTVYPGGLPILAEGDVVGAVGVSGGEGDQDADCARSGVSSIGLMPG
jgi:uncharacterized protein GlcG (DUF336 family)